MTLADLIVVEDGDGTPHCTRLYQEHFRRHGPKCTCLGVVEDGDRDAPLALPADAPVVAALSHGGDALLAACRQPLHAVDRRQRLFPADLSYIQNLIQPSNQSAKFCVAEVSCVSLLAGSHWTLSIAASASFPAHQLHVLSLQCFPGIEVRPVVRHGGAALSRRAPGHAVRFSAGWTHKPVNRRPADARTEVADVIVAIDGMQQGRLKRVGYGQPRSRHMGCPARDPEQLHALGRIALRLRAIVIRVRAIRQAV